jgi:hypothetical protein
MGRQMGGGCVSAPAVCSRRAREAHWYDQEVQSVTPKPSAVKESQVASLSFAYRYVPTPCYSYFLNNGIESRYFDEVSPNLSFPRSGRRSRLRCRGPGAPHADGPLCARRGPSTLERTGPRALGLLGTGLVATVVLLACLASAARGRPPAVP